MHAAPQVALDAVWGILVARGLTNRQIAAQLLSRSVWATGGPHRMSWASRPAPNSLVGPRGRISRQNTGHR